MLPGLHHLILFGQVDPQLKPPQIPLCNLGHFAVHNASPSSHPLHTPRTNHPLWKTTGSCLVCACGGLAVCCYAEKVLVQLYIAIAGPHVDNAMTEEHYFRHAKATIVTSALLNQQGVRAIWHSDASRSFLMDRR